MSEAPNQLAQDGSKGDVGMSTVLAVLFWVSVALGCFAALLQFATFTGDPDLLDHRWIVPWAMIGVVPAMGRVSICEPSQLGPIALTWTVIACLLLFMMDQGGLTIFGAIAGWWWWHYAIGGVLAVAPAVIAFVRSMGVMPSTPFVAIGVTGLLFSWLLAITGASTSDSFARLTRGVRVGMTTEELAEVLQGVGYRSTEPGRPFRYVSDATWASLRELSGEVEVWEGIQSYFEFEDGKLTGLVVNFD